MCLEEVVIGGGETEVLHPPGHEPRQYAGHASLKPDWKPRIGLEHLVSGTAEDVLWHYPSAAPRRDEHLLGHALARELRGDVDGAVADSHHQHPLAGQIERVRGIDVVVRVQRRPVEVAPKVGKRRVPMMSVADEQHIE